MEDQTKRQRKLGKLTIRHQQMIQGANSHLRGARLDVIIEEETDGSEAGEIFDVEPEKCLRNIDNAV